MKSFKIFLFAIFAVIFLSKTFVLSAEASVDLIPTLPTLSASSLPASNLTGGTVSWPVYVLDRAQSPLKIIFNTKNQGTTSTDQGFKNRITITNAPNGAGDIFYPELIDQNNIIAPGASAQTELVWNFQPGIYSIQACVDDEKITSPSGGYSFGVIRESAESNNCSEWTNIDIRDYSQNTDIYFSLTPYLYPATKTAILESRDTRGSNGVGSEYGFCVGTSPSPTDCKVTNPPENMIFSDSWVLNPSTKYYFRAYQKRIPPTDTRLATVVAYSADEVFTMSAQSTSSNLVISDAVRVDSNGNPTTDPIVQGSWGYFKTVVKNIGSGSTLFPSTSSIIHTTHPEEVINSNFWRDYSMGGSKINALGAGESKEITISGTFNDCGINWFKVCADDSSRNDQSSRRFGASYYIAETNELDNCSPGDWKNNTVDVACIVRVDGICSPSHYSCIAGKSSNNVDNGETWNWGCDGENGGNSVSCSEIKKIKLPNLTVLPGISPVSVLLNTAVTYTATVKNIGEDTTGKGFVNLFQTATDITNSMNPVGLKDYPTANMATLGVGASASTSSKNIPAFTSVGTYYIRACADKSSAGDAGDIKESDEGNNCNEWTQVVVTNDPFIDLIVSNVSPNFAVINKSTTFSATVKNEGNTGTGKDFQNFFQIAADPNGTVDVKDMPATTMPKLSAGGTDVMKLTHTFTKNGTYYVRACADKSKSTDTTGDIPESNENNNCSGLWQAIIVDDGSKCNEDKAANFGLPGLPGAPGGCFFGDRCTIFSAKNYGELLPCDDGSGTGGGNGGNTPAATCTDGQKNGKETGVDCGGDCKKCGLKIIEI